MTISNKQNRAVQAAGFRSLTCSNNSGYFLQKLGLLHNGWAQRLERLQADFVAIVEENEKESRKMSENSYL